jgi:hypothetical protein
MAELCQQPLAFVIYDPVHSFFRSLLRGMNDNSPIPLNRDGQLLPLWRANDLVVEFHHGA